MSNESGLDVGHLLENFADAATILTGGVRAVRLATGSRGRAASSIEEGRAHLSATMDILETHKDILPVEDVHDLRRVHNRLQDAGDRLVRVDETPFSLKNMSLRLAKDKYQLATKSTTFAYKTQNLHGRALRSSAKARSRKLEREHPDPTQTSTISDTWSLADIDRPSTAPAEASNEIPAAETQVAQEASEIDAHILSTEDVEQVVDTSIPQHTSIPMEDLADHLTKDVNSDWDTTSILTLQLDPWAHCT